MGKGLNGGYAPLSALLVKDVIVETIAKGSGGFLHAQNIFRTIPLHVLPALAVQEYIEKHDLVRTRSINGRGFEFPSLRVFRQNLGESGACIGDVLRKSGCYGQ